MKNEALLKNVQEVYSFEVEGETYQLDKINFNKAKKLINLIQTLNRLEVHNKIKVITRGFSIRDNNNHFSHEEHGYFFNHELNKFFIVGQKGAHYLEEQLRERRELYTYNMSDRMILIHEIFNLYEDANKILKTIQVNGTISSRFIEFTDDTPLSQLQYNKIFLTAFLHNIGRKWSGKISSPLLSFSYGIRKKETAKNFATNALRDGTPRNDGFIILGYVPFEGRRFEKLTDDLNMELEELGVTWYENAHKEIMLLDGIMPQHIIGLFEVKENGEENFILNPWLGKMFSESRRFDYRRGITINQARFEEFATDLKYGAFILETDGGRYNKTFQDIGYHSVPEIKR
ncbi:hypothetical protein [Bacillus sp. 166amftsu]|uniref:hypothetical protein n=1 Tax=Bacillus sp. 166amftsu TaxID=1761753 RepID=UPI000895431D|nr:hypothetical protein [Bacillus sp. 166amftsu]SDZ00122.1 hypothetical protein SAMN04488156_10416 [Bacillus sp. 166amftsu]